MGASLLFLNHQVLIILEMEMGLFSPSSARCFPPLLFPPLLLLPTQAALRIMVRKARGQDLMLDGVWFKGSSSPP